MTSTLHFGHWPSRHLLQYGGLFMAFFTMPSRLLLGTLLWRRGFFFFFVKCECNNSGSLFCFVYNGFTLSIFYGHIVFLLTRQYWSRKNKEISFSLAVLKSSRFVIISHWCGSCHASASKLSWSCAKFSLLMNVLSSATRYSATTQSYPQEVKIYIEIVALWHFNSSSCYFISCYFCN